MSAFFLIVIRWYNIIKLFSQFVLLYYNYSDSLSEIAKSSVLADILIYVPTLTAKCLKIDISKFCTPSLRGCYS